MPATSRRVSYILPTPDDPPPYLVLPSIERNRRGKTSPFLDPKTENSNGHDVQSRNPFLHASELGDGDIPPNHPRHCLGITSLALDTSTVLAGASAPGGILYSGGRDGLVASWELSVPHKRRRGGRYEILPGRGGGAVKWEKIGDGAEFFDEDDDDDSEAGEPAGGVADSSDDGSERHTRGEVPYEDRWEIDRQSLSRSAPSATRYRQSAQTHTDWVNAMLLCNLNQTVITASSDRTIRAWNPHAASDSEGLSPYLVGTHRDYVRALTFAKHPSLLFSGSLDRTLAIWDVGNPSPDAPILSIDMSKAEEFSGMGMEGERGSVYALGVDPAGKVLAAGTPEAVVRLWDPRQGERSTGKLIGHSDCVRSVIISEDGRYILTGSSDTTIKLWSLAAHRCLHTFNHHTSSVWSLFSAHPNLERFYSGSRDGNLAVVDVEQCTEMADGECIALAREGDPTLRNGEYESKSGDEGVRCIVAMDDEYVWTATGSADIKRWRDVGRRVDRLEGDRGELDGVAYHEDKTSKDFIQPGGGIIQNKRLSLDNTTGEPLSRTESRESRSVAFAPAPSTGAAASSPSAIPTIVRDRLHPPAGRKTASGASIASSVASESSMEDPAGAAHTSHAGINGIPYESLVSLGDQGSPYAFRLGEDGHRSGVSLEAEQGKTHLRPEDASPRKPLIHMDSGQSATQARARYEEREEVSEATPLRSKPDDVIEGRPGLVRSLILNDRQHVLTVDTEGEVAAWNIIKGVCVGRFSAADVAAALDLERGVQAGAAVRKHSSEVLELVKDRVEGETMVITWCQVDTKIGSLVVHLEEGRVFDAEMYADELTLPHIDGIREDTRINLGKWALANLFKGLIKAEEREVTQSSPSSATSGLPSIQRSPAPTHISIDRPLASPPHRKRTLTNSSQPPMILGIASPAATPAILPDMESPLISRSLPSQPGSWMSIQQRAGPLSAIPQSPSSANTGTPGDANKADYFSIRKRAEPSPSREGGAAGAKDKPAPSPGAPASVPGQTPYPSTPGGSLMGKFKGFGKKSKATESTMAPVKEAEVAVVEEEEPPKLSERESAQLQILDTVRAHPFRPPPPWEAPPVEFPPTTALLIAEESKDAGAWVVTYRSQVKSTERDMESIENNSPMWLLDYLFTSRIKAKDPVKLTFILEPAPGSTLKEMPEGTTRLSASRVLRARKILIFIYEKLELGPSAARARQGSVVSVHSRITSQPGANRPSGDGKKSPVGGNKGAAASQTSGLDAKFEPEDLLELLCGNNVVDPKITLATLKQYYGSGGDMLLHYRLKEGIVL